MCGDLWLTFPSVGGDAVGRLTGVCSGPWTGSAVWPSVVSEETGVRDITWGHFALSVVHKCGHSSREARGLLASSQPLRDAAVTG